MNSWIQAIRVSLCTLDAQAFFNLSHLCSCRGATVLKRFRDTFFSLLCLFTLELAASYFYLTKTRVKCLNKYRKQKKLHQPNRKALQEISIRTQRLSTAGWARCTRLFALVLTHLAYTREIFKFRSNFHAQTTNCTTLLQIVPLAHSSVSAGQSLHEIFTNLRTQFFAAKSENCCNSAR